MKIKKKTIVYSCIFVLAVLLIAFGLFFIFKPSNSGFEISAEGVLNIKKLEAPKFRKSPFNENEYFTAENVVFESRNVRIYGLLLSPHTERMLPGAVLLPGAGVSKEAGLNLGATISSLGFVVFILDQRGVGETNGHASDINEDFNSYLKGEDTFQHLMVYDAVLAANVLRQMPMVEKEDIIIVGESMGGRNAIIAAAVDSSIRGVVGISTSGFGFVGGKDKEKDKFIKSIDADTYAPFISPRKIALVHNLHDNIIPFESAARTYGNSNKPKILLYINQSDSCRHGYCEEMHGALKTSLQFVVGNLE